jgi:hypothetical protein
MSEVRWVFVERCRGKMRRVTALDRHLDIVTVHERPGHEPDEFQLLSAVELTSRLSATNTATTRAPHRRRDGALGS